MKMKELCVEERPREKLIERGAASLGNAELIAVLLRTGGSGKNVLELANELLKQAGGNLTSLSGMSLERLKQISGIGNDKSATIFAAFELGRRFRGEKYKLKKKPVTDASIVNSLISPVLKGLDHEECWIIFLNRAKYVVGMERISSGTIRETSVDQNAILRKAVDKKADAIIMVHNHPSGNPCPSSGDKIVTERLRRTAESFGISLLDHVIVSDDSYFSFADEMTTEVGRVDEE